MQSVLFSRCSDVPCDVILEQLLSCRGILNPTVKHLVTGHLYTRRHIHEVITRSEERIRNYLHENIVRAFTGQDVRENGNRKLYSAARVARNDTATGEVLSPNDQAPINQISVSGG